eukprot:3147167-Amphidinium_carterae.2
MAEPEGCLVRSGEYFHGMCRRIGSSIVSEPQGSEEKIERIDKIMCAFLPPLVLDPLGPHRLHAMRVPPK